MYCDKCGLWIHVKSNKINKHTYIYLMCENSHWYYMLCAKTFLPYCNEFKWTVIGKQSKFIHIGKPAISDAENLIKVVNCENNITKCFTIKEFYNLNSTFNYIGSPFSLFHLNINSLFQFDELQSLILESKNDFQIFSISIYHTAHQKPDLKRLSKQQQIFSWKL